MTQQQADLRTVIWVFALLALLALLAFLAALSSLILMGRPCCLNSGPLRRLHAQQALEEAHTRPLSNHVRCLLVFGCFAT